MKAHFQGDESDAVEVTKAVGKKEHLEGQGDGQLEQEAGGPLHAHALGDTQISYAQEEPSARGRGVESLSGGRQADAKDVASIVEELWKMYPKRRHISPATRAFITTLLGIGLTKPQVCRMFHRDVKLFARSCEAFKVRRELLARHGICAAGFQALLRRDTWWLSKPLQEVESTILYIERLLGGPGEAAVRAFMVYPQILCCSEANLEEKVQALQRVGVRNVTKVVSKYPKVLSDHSAQDIADKAAALKGALGPELALAVLERHPQVVRGSMGVRCEHLAWLEKTFGQAAALQMVERQPSVVGSKVETASATYASLVGTFGEAGAHRMLFVQPCLLAYNSCTLEAKLDFLTEELGHTLDEVASCPSVLMYSLKGRIQPRAAALLAAGRPYGRLSTLLKCSDKKFELAYGVCLPRVVASSSEVGTSQGSGVEDQPHLGSTR